MKILSNKKYQALCGLFFVVLVWGIYPLVAYELNQHFSPTFKVSATKFILLTSYVIMSRHHFNKLDKSCIKSGSITGLFLALADTFQTIGLLYTTPAKSAFLENLSILSVPPLMYILVNKKPTVITLLSCAMCLFGVFLLNGADLNSSWGFGELLCGIAGIFYGVNIAVTSCMAKRLFAPLYLAVQAAVGLIVSLVLALILNTVKVPGSATGAVIEKIVFPLDFRLIAFLIIFTVTTSALCWTIRTNAMKHISASAVSVIMPFSAVITAVLSAFFGIDKITPSIIFGGGLMFFAIILSAFDKS